MPGLCGLGDNGNSGVTVGRGMYGKVSCLAISGMIALAGCGSSGGSGPGSAHANAADAKVAVTPADGSGKVRPDKGVQVTASSGTIQQVTVQTGNSTVDGALSADKKSWQTKWTLRPGKSYTVTAVAKNGDGKTVTSTSKFSTAKASSTVSISDITPNRGEKVGVGMPIMVSFDKAVANRENVEKALEVRSTSPVVGAWHWTSNQQVLFRPQKYWPAHTDVSLVAHMAGVRASAGAYGTTDTTRSFKIGASHITKVNLKTDHEKVYVDGKKVKTIAVSGGMGGSDSHGNDFRTTSGIHLAMGKSPVVTMTSPNVKKGEPGYYHELVYEDVQISNSGEYLHRSPGDFDCLGDRNCSHGCVRQSVSGAAWFYKLSMRGDVIDISGTSRDLAPDNGWGYWQNSWKTWLKGSALKQPVTTTALTPAAPTPPASTSPAPTHS